MLPLPIPKRGGSWEMLKPLINSFDPENFALLVAWIVSTLSPVGPYAILMTSGEKGSWKSTTCEIARMIVDPVESPRRTLPESERDLMVEAMAQWIVAYDNLSGITRKQSDMLCRLSTGGGSSQRRLHSNAEQVVLSAIRPQVLNGIVNLGTYPDLLSRGLAVALPVVPAGMAAAEGDVRNQFESVWPKLLGLVCDAASAALRNLPSVKISELPRMADFTRWVYAAAIGGTLPFTGDEFLAIYEDNRKLAFIDTLEAAPFARSIQKLMEQIPEFVGTAEELRLELNRRFGSEISRYPWSMSNEKIGNQINDMGSVIREAGIKLERFRESRHIDRNRPWKIRLRSAETRSDPTADQKVFSI